MRVIILYSYVNLNSSIICCLSSGDIYLSFGIYVSLSTVSKYFVMIFVFCNFTSTFITNQITSCFCCFLNCFFEAVLWVSVADCLARSRNFWSYLLLKFFPILFYSVFAHIFSKEKKICNLLQISNFLVELNSESFLYFAFWLMTKGMFIYLFSPAV